MAPVSNLAPSSLLTTTTSSQMWVDLQGTFTPFAVQSGLVCLAAQCAVFFVLKVLGRNPSTAGPWSRRAGFTAHQVVCVPVLAYLTGPYRRAAFSALMCGHRLDCTHSLT
jgi:hypothetical protein